MKVIVRSYVTVMLVYQRVGWGDEGVESRKICGYIYI